MFEVATFKMDGDTLSDSFTLSSLGLRLDGVEIDRMKLLLNASQFFDTELDGTQPFQVFAPVAGSDVTTGLSTVNGDASPGTPANMENTTMLDLVFTDFEIGEEMEWMIDVDTAIDAATASDQTVTGAALAGSQVTIDFSTGQQVTGTFAVDPDDPDASILKIMLELGSPTINISGAATGAGPIFVTDFSDNLINGAPGVNGTSPPIPGLGVNIESAFGGDIFLPFTTPFDVGTNNTVDADIDFRVQEFDGGVIQDLIQLNGAQVPSL